MENVVPLRERKDRWPPPHNFEAEMALLAAILCNNKAYLRVSSFLRAEHFIDPDHREIYEAMGELINEGKAADPITLRSYFPENVWPEKGGYAYLAKLAASVVTIINADDYGRTIYDFWLRRALMDVASELDERTREVEIGTSAMDVVAWAEHALSSFTGDGGFSETTRSLTNVSQAAAELADAAHKADRAVIGLPTGYASLDATLGGLRPGELMIIGARTSMGKSDLGWNITQRVAAGGAKAMVFSLEMSAEELGFRAMAARADVPASVILAGRMTGDQPARVFAASTEISKLPIVINDEAGLRVAQMRAIARRHQPQLVLVDYLQLVTGVESGDRYSGIYERVTMVTAGLKAMAKSLKVPVIALCQLSRAVEGRENKRPQLSDLRESGAIEQDADAVLFLYRDEYYLQREKPKTETAKLDIKTQLEEVRGIAEVHIAKQRMGPTKTIELRYTPALSRFDDPPAPIQDDGDWLL